MGLKKRTTSGQLHLIVLCRSISCSWHPTTGITSQPLQKVGLKKKLNSPSLPLPVPMRRQGTSLCEDAVGSSFLVSQPLTCVCAQGITMGS